MILPRKSFLLTLSVALLIVVGSWWAVSLRSGPVEIKSDPMEIRTGVFTEYERDEWLERGIIVLPGAQNVVRTTYTRSKDTKKYRHHGLVAYELDGEFGHAELVNVADSIVAALKETGWSYRRVSRRIWTFFSVPYKVTLHNRQGTLDTDYTFVYRRESPPDSPPTGLVIRAWWSPSYPDISTSKRRPIS